MRPKNAKLPQSKIDANARLRLRFKQSVGIKLRNIRISRKKTLDIIALKLGMSESHLRRIEKGRCDTGISIIGRLCAEYGIKPNDLFDGTEFLNPYVKD
ncbi:helix-turn-helix domain-containing protein [Puia sp. P3]|uniref:helix-turn-helix domain-containing protein n=1 Tax=Puia sp. P3 TaxID=3423952 RepID=UPI003D66CA2E